MFRAEFENNLSVTQPRKLTCPDANSWCIPLPPDYSLVARATKISNAQKQPPDEKLDLSQCGINRIIQIHQSCVIFCLIQLNNCVFLQQSSAADLHWQYFSFVFGIPQSSHVSWQRQFKLDLILLGTMSCSQLTSIEQWHRSLSPQCILLQHLKFPIIGYKPCLHDTGHPAAGYVCI